MKTYVIVGAVVGTVVGVLGSLFGVELNIWLSMGTGALSALIAGQIENRRKG